MPTKEEYEEIFNKLLGTDIRWSKLSKHELVQLAILFNNPELLLKKLGVKIEKTFIKDRLVDVFLDFTKNFEGGPVIKMLRKLLIEEEEEK